MGHEPMDWGPPIDFALLLTAAIFVPRALWCWLVILMVLGPPAYAGIVAGHFVSALTNDVGAGLLTAVIMTGMLSAFVRRALSADAEGSGRR